MSLRVDEPLARTALGDVQRGSPHRSEHPLPPRFRAMQHPPPRQHRIVGGVHAARDSRTAADENPFASFYESRRKISLETDDDDTSDPSSSITRAYIVPDALLALARGE